LDDSFSLPFFAFRFVLAVSLSLSRCFPRGKKSVFLLRMINNLIRRSCFFLHTRVDWMLLLTGHAPRKKQQQHRDDETAPKIKTRKKKLESTLFFHQPTEVVFPFLDFALRVVFCVHLQQKETRAKTKMQGKKRREQQQRKKKRDKKARTVKFFLYLFCLHLSLSNAIV